MHIVFAVLASALQILYQAQVPTFGCTSGAEVAELQQLRADTAAFEKLLFSQVVYGQCITIGQGAIVEGAVEPTDSTVLRINAEIDPPGYIVPSADFKLMQADGTSR